MRNNKGFTLIELLVVIGIVSILVSVVIVALNPNRQKAADDCKKYENTRLNSIPGSCLEIISTWHSAK